MVAALPTPTSYVYDALGRRVAESSPVATYFYYSHEGKLLFTNDHKTQASTDHIYLSGSLVAARKVPFAGGAEVTYQHTDALGSPVAFTNAAGTIVRRERMTAWGEPADGSWTSGPGYTGHQMDVGSKLVYMQQRYYDPVVGRFLSVDPVPTNPSTGGMFNRYNYAHNNPYRFTDPNGRCPEGSTPKTCISSTEATKPNAGSVQISQQTRTTARSKGIAVIVKNGSRDEVVGAITNDGSTGRERVQVLDSDTSSGNGADRATASSVPKNMVAVIHGHTGPTLADSPEAGSMGDAQVLKDNGVPNIAVDTTGRQAIHQIVDGRYEIHAAPGTRFTKDEIDHFTPRMDERQRYLNGE